MPERESDADLEERTPVVLEYGRCAALMESVSVFAVLAGIFAIGTLVCASLRHHEQARVTGVALGAFCALFAGKAAFATDRPIAPRRKMLLGVVALTGLSGGVANLIAGMGRTTDGGYSITSCAFRMRQMGQQLYSFAMEHSGKFPASLGELKELPEEFDASHVVYLGEWRSVSSPADQVLMYESPGVHGGKGMHVLYVDARVVWVEKGDVESMMKAIDAQTKNLPKPRRDNEDSRVGR